MLSLLCEWRGGALARSLAVINGALSAVQISGKAGVPLPIAEILKTNK
jgi:hypothetical protein